MTARGLASGLARGLARGIARGSSGGVSVPVFTTQPSNQSTFDGNTATFTSEASGSPSPTYQWQLDSGGGFANISGATNRILTLEAVELTDDGNEYKCIASNSEGSAESNVAILTVSELSGIGSMEIGSTFAIG